MAEIREITPLFLTAPGLRLQAKVQTGAAQLNVVRVLIGSGYLDSETDKELLTSPIAEIPSHTSRGEGTDAQVDVTRLFYDEGDGVAMISIHIESGDNESTHLREICIIASDPDDGEIMYGYTNLGDEALPLPKYDGRSRAVYDINLPTVIANASDVTVNITRIVEVSTEEFDTHKTTPVIDHPDRSVTSAKLADSIALRGTPTAPTAADDTNNTQIATTEFVQREARNVLSKLQMKIFKPIKITILLGRHIGSHGSQYLNGTTMYVNQDEDDISEIYRYHCKYIYSPTASVYSSTLYLRLGVHTDDKYRTCLLVSDTENFDKCPCPNEYEVRSGSLSAVLLSTMQTNGFVYEPESGAVNEYKG